MFMKRFKRAFEPTARKRGDMTRVLVALALSGCTPVGTDTTVVLRPEGRSNLAVTAGTDTPEVFESMAVTLTANATGGTAPYLYRWDQNGGPVELVLDDATLDTPATEALATPGRYVFRALATDSEGFHATDFVAVVVHEAVTVEAPKLIVVGEPVELTATLESDAQGASVVWEVVRGSATLDDSTSTEPLLTATVGETIEVVLTVTLPSTGDAPAITATRTSEIVAVPDLHPKVVIRTNFGEITMEFDGEKAPLYTVNFLAYVDDGFYDGLLFHRNACSENLDTGECDPFVLQGGGYRRVDGELTLREPTRDPVPSEADNGLSNGTVYSVSLALGGAGPDSGTTQFFINLADNAFLDEQDFTVFGMVVDGTDVVDAITQVETTESPFIPGEVSLPGEDVMIEKAERVSP
jgi:cyclophilin family peptidyl-prolyl cis-trans isomerase